VFLVLLTTIFWGRLLFGGLVFYARDLGFFFAPLRAAYARAVLSGSAPLWNPWIGCGAPMAADPNNSAFFPPNLLFLLQPFSRGLRAFSAAWVFALPLFSYAGLRKLRLSPLSSAASAGAMAVCGPAMTLTCLPSTAWAWVFFFPLLSTAAGTQRGGIVRTSMAGVLFGLVVLAGEPAIALQILFAFAVFAFDRQRPLASLRPPLAVAILGALIAAPQVVGALELLPQTARGSGLPIEYGAAFHSVRPLRLLEFLWPGLFGDPNSPLARGYWGSDFFDAGGAYVNSLAVGTAALLLAPAARFDRRGRRFLLLAAFGCVFSFGRFLPGGSLVLGLPGFSLFRYPEKWLFLSSFSLLAAAGCALDLVSAGENRARRAALRSASAVVALGLAASAAIRFLPASTSRFLEAARVLDRGARGAGSLILASLSREILQVAVFGTLCGAVILTAKTAGARKRSPVWLAALLFADLLPRTMNWLPLAPSSFYDTAPASIGSLRPSSGRLYFGEETAIALDPLRPLSGNFFGFEYAGNNDIDRFSPRRSFFFGLDLSRLPVSDPRRAALLRLAGVTLVSTIHSLDAVDAAFVKRADTSESRSVFSLADGRRFRLLSDVSRAESEIEARAGLLARDFDPDRQVVLEGNVIASKEASFGEIRPGARISDRESVEVVTSGPAVLLRSETFEPRWTATIDGSATKVLPADFAFQAVVVPPGRHQIEFIYRDRAMTAALFVSLLALALPAGFLSLRRK
jgi:hypothetical protein